MRNIILGAALAASVAMPAMAQVAVELEPGAREFIVREGRPSVAFDGDIVVGTALPETVEVYEIEGAPTTTYRYTVVNDRRVIVDPQTRRVIQIIE